MTNQSPSLETFSYDDAITRKFLLATILWGFIGMFVGVYIAFELAMWQLNFDIPWITFGRLRPLHTNAVIFAFAGNAIFTGVYYSTQRLIKARMYSDALSKIHFWGWQLIILLAAITLPAGITASKEYAELEWPIDILITVVWIAFAANLFATLARRREKHIYVAIWFYISTVLAVGVLHIVNSLEIPVSFTKSYSVFAGVQDALVQWWYGHNAVAFFLTTPFLGLMYYFIPKAAGRPIYSYRLSVIHFWSLVFIYIWAGPHHLLNTALPDWAQTMGMVFSIMLIAPSWGGMINGLLTLRGAWNKLREDVVLKFLVVGITFYGMSTFEGPLLSFRALNSLSHYTDWTISHVHGGTLGWNGFITFGMIYWLTPKLWKVELWSKKLMTWHFWLSTIGIVLYLTSMWTSGITQGLMWKAFAPDGRLLYPDFIETVTKLNHFFWIRAIGGSFYITGLVLMMLNIWKTISVSSAAKADLSDPVHTAPSPFFHTVLEPDEREKNNWHYRLEGRVLAFTVLTLIAILIGGIVEIVPLIAVRSNVPTISSVRPYTPLELEGRDVYIREGCYVCHSQLVRTLPEEVVRYGDFSKAGEFVYDHPFQFGSKRTGPDLHRVGAKYNDFWHYRHMMDPRSTTPGSIMPAYPWLYSNKLYKTFTGKKMEVMKKLGVPYSQEEIDRSSEALKAQAKGIRDNLVSLGVEGKGDLEDLEITALIAHLQRLGTDIKGKK